MKFKAFILIPLIFAFASCVMALPARASTPPVLLDVVEIVDPAPFIIHTNILPGDTFLHPMTVKNLTSAPQNIVMSLHIDPLQGLVPNPPFELEERINVKIERVGSGFLTLPGPGGDDQATLQELSDTLIDLGSIPALDTQDYKISFVFDPTAGNEYQNTKVYFNVAISIDVPDVQGSLRIEKSNDSVGDEAPGNEVEYTLRVTALHDDVNDVVLTDLPPEGFEYVPGSGDGAPFIHEYASPGIWDLGDMEAGETKTVTYRTRISDAQDDGLYKDLAFATGISGSGTILADDPVDDPDNALHDNFVGTRVIVAANANPTVLVPQDDENRLIEKTKKKIQYVLGAATLPLTGANGGWMLLALVLLATGIGLALWGRRLKKENQANDHATLMKTFLFTLFAGSLLLTGQGVSAASLAVQIEKPEAVVNNPNFKIGFVTLDIEKREVTVKCYASYEGGPAVVFDQYTLLADPNFGGNSGDCQVDATVMPAEGDYGFFVTATAQNEEDIDEMATSETVPVKLVASPPGTPFNYDRHDASCQNTITFTTADDGGKTVKVELYRSPSATFTADASTKVDEQAIGSNANGSFNEAAPGCSNDYFYALRAVDAYGFGSGFVGDKDVNVDTHTVTHTKTNTVTVPGAPAEGALVAAPTGTGAAGAVEGATTGGESVTGEEGNVLGETIAGAEGAVSGMSTWITAHPWWSVLILLILMALGYYGYGVYQRKRHVPLQ